MKPVFMAHETIGVALMAFVRAANMDSVSFRSYTHGFIALVLIVLVAGVLKTTHATAQTLPVVPALASAEFALTIDGESTLDPECHAAATLNVRIRCGLDDLYADAPQSATVARQLFERHGVVAGVERAHTFNGGFRGQIMLVPARPVGPYAQHLVWVSEAHDAIATVLAGISPHARAPIRYDHRGIVYAFTRSVGRTTPSAYARGWRVGYNVDGSLHRDTAAVFSTLVHEIAHLNDEEYGGVLSKALRPVHRRILAACRGDSRCLAPVAPTRLRVRGGTYYAFQPNNGDAVKEYAADLASRYFAEHREILYRGRMSSQPWKCARAENAEAYSLIALVFFGGVDLTPPCRR